MGEEIKLLEMLKDASWIEIIIIIAFLSPAIVTAILQTISLLRRTKSGKNIENNIGDVKIALSNMDNKISQIKEEQITINENIYNKITETNVKLDDVVDFNNNHKYIHLLEVRVLQIFDDFINDNFIENKESILLLHNIKANLTDFYTKIVLAGWRYFDYQKLTKAWENFYTKAKRPISICKLNIVGKEKEKQFTEEIDRIIIEEFPKNYFNPMISVFQLENGDRKNEFDIIVGQITKQLILTIISIINKYKQ